MKGYYGPSERRTLVSKEAGSGPRQDDSCYTRCIITDSGRIATDYVIYWQEDAADTTKKRQISQNTGIS
jgi:hypothetical protein